MGDLLDLPTRPKAMAHRRFPSANESVETKKFVMIDFMPRGGHFHPLTQGSSAAVEVLKAEDAMLARVNVTKEAELSQGSDVCGFATVFFFMDGVKKNPTKPAHWVSFFSLN